MGFTFIFAKNVNATIKEDNSRVTNSTEVTNNTDTTNHSRQPDTASELEWLDLTETEDCTYSYVGPAASARAEPENRGYNAGEQNASSKEAKSSVKNFIIDLWA